jgi:flagellar motor switch protein FliN/FliY
MKALEEISGFENVPLAVNVELDRRALTVREVLQLKVGKTLKMQRSAGENLDLRIGDALIGYGEIVVSETTIGLRITDFNNKE